eukprot:gb/GFBE01002775.1/.p1 GENE.gb/GFBE01002775.1/~~gb/GFBE01002775.1/.p1  ORF type:complete len:271 (+),score=42.86 gb/GFBE01002775.1/:1-813(+)
MTQTLGFNDAILFVSLTYSIIDLQYDSWDAFNSCSHPIHHWLLMSYVCVIAFRVTHLLGVRALGTAASSNFLLDLRQKGTGSRLLTGFTWLVALPFFVVWTGIGTFWMYEVMRKTPDCMPSATHTAFACLWLVLSYGWILIHLALAGVAVTLEVRVRRAEADLREVADAETVSRWGQVNQLSSYTSLNGTSDKGLSPTEIKALPLAVCEECDADTECSICLNCLEPGEPVRSLPSCGHSFHRSCIDLWLLRSADCPLCKGRVGGDVAEAA